MAGCKIVITFAKVGLMRFYSHLDLLRLFSRALRRADIPVSLSGGFNPRPRMKITRALKLGVESRSETAEFILDEEMSGDEFARRLKAELPKGIEIIEADIVK
jgi:radical SAM-linked protein